MSLVHFYTKNLEQYTCILKFSRKGMFFLLTVIKSKLSTTATLGTEESRRYGAVSVGVKYDTDILLGFNIFILKKT